MNDDALIVEIGALATVFICIMTVITFGITIGVWEASLWESNLVGASIIGCDGYWGEDLVVTYTNGYTESVKRVSDNYWATMSIQDDGSRPISTVQYCLNAKIPTSDSFDITGYECTVTVTQNSVVAYRTTYVYVGLMPVVVEENQWSRVVTVSLNVQDVAEGLNNGRYTVSFDNIGTIENINVPDGRSIDIFVDDGIVTFLI